TARLGKESIEIELQRVRKGPKPFNSAKMADLAACIQRLKGSNSSFMYKNGVGAGAKYEAPIEVKKDDVYVVAIDEGEADESDDYESGSSEEDDEVVETEVEGKAKRDAITSINEERITRERGGSGSGLYMQSTFRDKETKVPLKLNLVQKLHLWFGKEPRRKGRGLIRAHI
ncbi:hypothetical protein U1Q18_018101, partial [Sarracenia purpurea var. burkii]